MYEIIIGRNEEDRRKFGSAAMFHLGKHYVKMGQTSSLSNDIYMDVARSHVVFVVGKRGTGKSFSLGVIAEGISTLPEEVSSNVALIILDTMGIYWTMKYESRETELLREWGLKPGTVNVQIYTPAGYYDDFKERGIPTDFPFSVKTSELDAEDWCTTFGIDINSEIGVLIARAVESVQEKGSYSVMDIVEVIRNDGKSLQHVRDAAENHFVLAEKWGLFSESGTEIRELAAGGRITVLDVSCYATAPDSSQIRALVIGLICGKLFKERMAARRQEEYEQIRAERRFEEPLGRRMPLTWIMVDECHEFLPRHGETLATRPLITLLREGRQPGISLVLASQQPGKVHSDVITQSDIVLAHRLTARIDIDALGALMQTYMRESLDKALNELPSVSGAAILFDDTNERLYNMRVRPRLTWHGGSSPTPIPEKKAAFPFYSSGH